MPAPFRRLEVVSVLSSSQKPWGPHLDGVPRPCRNPSRSTLVIKESAFDCAGAVVPSRGFRKEISRPLGHFRHALLSQGFILFSFHRCGLFPRCCNVKCFQPSLQTKGLWGFPSPGSAELCIRVGNVGQFCQQSSETTFFVQPERRSQQFNAGSCLGPWPSGGAGEEGAGGCLFDGTAQAKRLPTPPCRKAASLCLGRHVARAFTGPEELEIISPLLKPKFQKCRMMQTPPAWRTARTDVTDVRWVVPDLCSALPSLLGHLCSAVTPPLYDACRGQVIAESPSNFR